jgi:hypothetical protein
VGGELYLGLSAVAISIMILSLRVTKKTL